MILHTMLIHKGAVITLTGINTLKISGGAALLLMDGNPVTDFDAVVNGRYPLAMPLPDGTEIYTKTGSLPGPDVKIKAMSDILIRYVTLV